MNRVTRLPLALAALAVASLAGFQPGCGNADRGRPEPKERRPAPQPSTRPAGTTAPSTSPAAEAGWRSLFDGKSLDGWRVSDFGGHGEARVEEGKLIIPSGLALSGVTWKADPPFKMNYEISLEAQKVDGIDFFCGLTFPVGDSHASLVLGGWAGTVCGISSVDGEDAAHNETSSSHEFKKGQWYRVRVKVMPKSIQAWVDDERIVNLDTEGKKIDVRADISEAKPLGISTYQTTAALRDIKVRPLRPDELPGK